MHLEPTHHFLLFSSFNRTHGYAWGLFNRTYGNRGPASKGSHRGLAAALGMRKAAALPAACTRWPPWNTGLGHAASQRRTARAQNKEAAGTGPWPDHGQPAPLRRDALASGEDTRGEGPLVEKSSKPAARSTFHWRFPLSNVSERNRWARL